MARLYPPYALLVVAEPFGNIWSHTGIQGPMKRGYFLIGKNEGSYYCGFVYGLPVYLKPDSHTSNEFKVFDSIISLGEVEMIHFPSIPAHTFRYSEIAPLTQNDL